MKKSSSHFRSLADFVSLLEREGELVRIKVPVDPVSEIAEITDRVHKAGGSALLFENTGTQFPVLTNMFGTPQRLALALSDDLPQIRARIGRLLGCAMSPADGLRGKLQKLPLLAEISHFAPRKVRRRGACQQVVMWREGDTPSGDKPTGNLLDLPVLKCWPHDGGRFITLPLVHTIDPRTGARNVGMYRMQVQDGITTGMHWHVHKTGERHYREWKKLNPTLKKMPVTVCLGGDPAYTYAATAPMPEGMDECMLAGFLRRRRVRLVRCLTNELWVPEDCDFVIEGYVDTTEPKFREGPFGDHTGFYSLDDLYPAFHVTAITHRRNAIYPATVVGVPPQEDFQIALATENIFVSPLRLLNPEVTDLHMPAAGVAHNLALMSIEAAWPGQALKTASAMWGAGQMMFNKVLLLLPESVSLHNASEVARRMRNARVDEDIMMSHGVLDALDHATTTPGVGGKIAIDLTSERPSKHPRTIIPRSSQGMEQRSAPPTDANALATCAEGIAAAGSGGVRCHLPANGDSPASHLLEEWGALIIYGATGEMDAVFGTSEADGAGHIIDLSLLRDVNFVVLADAATMGLTDEELLWHVLANTDPARDVVVRGESLLVDGRTKSPRIINSDKRLAEMTHDTNRAALHDHLFNAKHNPSLPRRVPNVVASSTETIVLVDGRWAEYGLGALIPSPSLRYAPLVYSDKAEV